MTSLDLALIGNGTIGASSTRRPRSCGAAFRASTAIPRSARCCTARRPATTTPASSPWTCSTTSRTEQEYLVNTPILRHPPVRPQRRLHRDHRLRAALPPARPHVLPDDAGAADPADRRQPAHPGAPAPGPRRTAALARRRSPAAATTSATSAAIVVLRLTTDASITAMLEENALLSGRHGHAAARARRNGAGRRGGSRRGTSSRRPSPTGATGCAISAIPFEWQDAVIRAAITLQAQRVRGHGRHHRGDDDLDSRSRRSAAATGTIAICWLRDAYFVVNALNRLGATRTMERYLRYILNIVAGAPTARCSSRCTASAAARPRGARSRLRCRLSRHGPGARRQPGLPAGAARRVRLGDPGGDPGLLRPAPGPRAATRSLFHRLEALGERAARLFDQPDAGIWELRGTPRVHTFSSVMCWAGCDRLARIAPHLGLADRADVLARARRRGSTR